YGVGLTLVLVAFLLVTVLRSIRADFAPEIWQELGVRESEIYAISETFVALGVVVCSGFSVLIGDNRRAFFVALALSVGGLVLVGLALVGLRMELLPALAFMVLLGLGLYLPYVAIHTTVFERLIAMTRERGNICYLMALADALG